jgi:hypothetical protein
MRSSPVRVNVITGGNVHSGYGPNRSGRTLTMPWTVMTGIRACVPRQENGRRRDAWRAICEEGLRR